MQLRPLGIVKEMLEENGEKLSYTYEDLVFTEHNIFLIQFNDESPSELDMYMNKDCQEEVGLELLNKLEISAITRECTVNYKGKYELFQEEGKEEFQVKFL